jgi:hypothetical protein
MFSYKIGQGDPSQCVQSMMLNEPDEKPKLLNMLMKGGFPKKECWKFVRPLIHETFGWKISQALNETSLM